MFKFLPLEKVIVNAFGLNAPGRVIECVLRPLDFKVYVVESCIDGRLITAIFNEDDINKIN